MKVGHIAISTCLGVKVEEKKKEDSSEEEEAMKDASKAQSMKSLFAGQKMTAKR